MSNNCQGTTKKKEKCKNKAKVGKFCALHTKDHVSLDFELSKFSLERLMKLKEQVDGQLKKFAIKSKIREVNEKMADNGYFIFTHQWMVENGLSYDDLLISGGDQRRDYITLPYFIELSKWPVKHNDDVKVDDNVSYDIDEDAWEVYDHDDPMTGKGVMEIHILLESIDKEYPTDKDFTLINDIGDVHRCRMVDGQVVHTIEDKDREAIKKGRWSDCVRFCIGIEDDVEEEIEE